MKTTHAAAAQAIRRELKQAFPTIKFCVRSQSYAGGDSVSISWDDGPTYPMVEAITNKYQYGTFDGMSDSYEYTNTREDIPQTKYIQTRRELSDTVKHDIQTGIIKEFGLESWDDWYIMDKFQVWPDELIQRYARKKSYA